MLLPIDEGAVIVDGVDSTHRVLIDSLSDTSGVYLLDAADVVRGTPTSPEARLGSALRTPAST